MSKITKMGNTKIPKKEIKMPSSSAASKSGSGMDRKITTKNQSIKKLTFGVLVLITVAYLISLYMNSPTGMSRNIDSNKLIIATVSSGTFEDFIPVRGKVSPAKTLYLDAIDGGRIERILVEDGTRLKKGELIVVLSNSTLQLSVLGNEARVAEQLNNMRTIELSLEQNRLQHKRNLVDINYQIKMLTRQYNREKGLAAKGSISKNKFNDTRDTLEWYKNQKAVTLESQISDRKMQIEQLKFLKDTSERLESNLQISRNNLDNMNVRAPLDGTLSGFDVEVGQSIARGERLGQIDTPNDYKITANIDEFYLNRIELGQVANFDKYSLIISKIYPHVENGKFEVDFKFIDEQPENIRRGQNIQTRLTLGDSTKALLIPNGPFLQDTGGNWIFVVSKDNSSAVKRQVKLGRRNNRYIEVLEGLDVGDQVVAGSYSNYQDIERLNLSN